MEAKQLLELPSVFPAEAHGSVRLSSSVQATLPLPVSQKWVAHACRMAGVGKPRWNRHTSTWTTTATRANDDLETVTIRHGDTPRSVTIEVSWNASDETSTHTPTARRLVTSLFTGMLWALRHEKLARTSL